MVLDMSNEQPQTIPVELDEALNTDIAMVIHEAVNNRGETVGWAWCKVSPVGEPGYEKVTCTRTDGYTTIDTPSDLRLGAVVVKLWC